MENFSADIDIIGINPFVLLPESVLRSIFEQAARNKGPIPVRGKIDGHDFLQTLVKYSGAWRLYINGPMLKTAAKRVGDRIEIEIEFDPLERVDIIHPKLQTAFDKNPKAKTAFNNLTASRQKEIIKYINFLKTETAIDKNVEKVIQSLLQPKSP